MLGIGTNYELQRLTVPGMLFAREQFGINSRHHSRRVTVSDLCYHVAWNPTRMQNMVLSVGPGTPAAVCMIKPSSNNILSEDFDSDEDGEIEEQEHSYSDVEDDDIAAAESTYDENEAESIESEDSLRSGDANQVQNMRRSQEVVERALMEWMEAEDIESEEVEDRSNSPKLKNVPSIRHGGCINTSTWLTSPWRLSSCGRDIDSIITQHTQDCPTQLITSGDDRMVKFWDLRQAMGMSNLLPGGKNTVCPFSTEVPLTPPIKEWKNYFFNSSAFMSGSVIPLATLATGHRGNVFHVTPLDHDPGKVVTCGADGYLRCSDLLSQSSSIVISPEYDRHDQNLFLSPGGLFSLRPGMCFSHHFVDTHNGLLCSERGLRRFDIRINPREQQSTSLLSSGTCKACAVWSRDSINSSYVFVGGSSADVTLYDLRMLTDGRGPSSKVVQLYRPRYLAENASVSVSGIDISKNKRELLISYENDQIYSFPICPSASAAGPTVDELDMLVKETQETGSIQRELCSYGGHLNRYTFLKNARYAGPNDDYICTGSDSGHAWIYKKDTGAVVSFLNADHSTCNGVVPHPTLPFFVTYGIDSTAKLWRATIPVDSDVDDSPLGRAQFHHRKSSYTRSPLVTDWLYCKERLSELCDLNENNSICVMPDEIPMPSAISDGGVFGRIYRNNRNKHSNQEEAFIGNDMQSLPQVLRQNLFSCIVALENDDDEPVRSGINELKRRISNIRLHFQANQKGLIPDSIIPWQLKARTKYIGIKTCPRSNYKAQEGARVEYGDPVDAVPEYPCDWIPFDPDMINPPLECGLNVNLEDYESFFMENYKLLSPSSIKENEVSYPIQSSPQRNKRKLDSQDSNEMGITCNKAKPTIVTPLPSNTKSFDEEKLSMNNNNSRAYQLIQNTVTLLKEAGNNALKAGFPTLAAQRYDQAIQYCAIAYLQFPAENLNLFLKQKIVEPNLEWSPLLQLLISTRLNLSMVLLRLPEAEPKKAAKLAKLALNELAPFAEEPQKIRKGPKPSKIYKEDEPESTYNATKKLQAKAYFRLGSAHFAAKDYSNAIISFEESLKSTKAVDEYCQPEQVVLRRLAESKREHARRNKKRRNKLKAIFGGGNFAAVSSDHCVGKLPGLNHRNETTILNPNQGDDKVISEN